MDVEMITVIKVKGFTKEEIVNAEIEALKADRNWRLVEGELID
jgi:hypothetical protein